MDGDKNRTFIKLFKTREKLAEMLEAINNGESLASIARRFSCHRATILYYKNKFGLGGVRKRKHVPRAGKFPPLQDYIFNQERINPGKNYKEYVKAERLRKEKEALGLSTPSG